MEQVTVEISREMAMVIYAYICDMPESASHENILQYLESKQWFSGQSRNGRSKKNE